MGCCIEVIQYKLESTPDIGERYIAWFYGKQRVQSLAKTWLHSRPYVISVSFMFAWQLWKKNCLIILNHIPGF